MCTRLRVQECISVCYGVGLPDSVDGHGHEHPPVRDPHSDREGSTSFSVRHHWSLAKHLICLAPPVYAEPVHGQTRSIWWNVETLLEVGGVTCGILMWRN